MEGFRPPFVPAWRGLSGSGALGKLRAAGSFRSLSCFTFLRFESRKDRANGPGKGELGLLTVFEQFVFVAESPEVVSVLTFYGYR